MLGQTFLWQRESWRAFWRQPSIVIPLGLAAILVLTAWVVVLTAPTPFENSLRLRYSIYIGTNWLASPLAFLYVPGLSTLCVLGNVACAYTIARRTLVLRHFWLWSAVVVALGWLWLAVLLRQFNA